MTRLGLFLCGCDPDEKKGYAANVDNGNFSFKRIDKEGFEVCPEHGERLYGWRTITKSTVDEKGRKIRDALDYSANSLASKRKLKLIPDNEEDHRDDRDPILVGAEILSKTNGHG